MLAVDRYLVEPLVENKPLSVFISTGLLGISVQKEREKSVTYETDLVMNFVNSFNSDTDKSGWVV